MDVSWFNSICSCILSPIIYIILNFIWQMILWIWSIPCNNWIKFNWCYKRINRSFNSIRSINRESWYTSNGICFNYFYYNLYTKLSYFILYFINKRYWRRILYSCFFCFFWNCCFLDLFNKIKLKR